MQDPTMDMLASKRAGRVMRTVHATHRTLGSAFSLLLATWFASGSVMTFARYPEYSDAERLADAPPLPPLAATMPPELEAAIAAGELANGTRARLSVIEAQPIWSLLGANGPRRAWRATAPLAKITLDADRARREAERRFRLHAAQATSIDEADQWTVGRSAPGDYPLFRIAFDDRDHTQVYLSARSGETIQQSTRGERLLAWLGPIPHWIYPAMLRRHRAWWSNSVIVLALLGLLVTSSGLAAGVHAAILRRRARVAQSCRVRDPYLLWHQRIGLGFGVFASTWLFSGALSLTPFDWSGPGPTTQQLASIFAAPPMAAGARVATALAHCREQLSVRELELASFAGGYVVVCVDGRGQTRIVDLNDPALTAQQRLDVQRFAALARTLSSQPVAVALRTEADDYYYATHADPPIATPYVSLQLHDAASTAFYFDPARGTLLAHLTQRKRLERWLYHGLHSFDVPALYRHRVLWHSVMIAAMLTGFSLATLGLVTRMRGAWKRRARANARRRG